MNDCGICDRHRRAKVDDLHVANERKHDVLRFEIAMNNMVLMQVFKPLEILSEDGKKKKKKKKKENSSNIPEGSLLQCMLDVSLQRNGSLPPIACQSTHQEYLPLGAP